MLSLISSKNLYGQNNNQSFSTGENLDSLVVVDLATIRRATIKLVERDEYFELNKQKDSLIIDYKNYIAEQDNNINYLKNLSFVLNEQNNEYERINNDLSKRLDRSKTWCNILGGTAIVGIASTVLLILMK